MAKPIFLIQVPNSVNYKDIDKITQSLTDRLPDYHVLCAASGNIEALEFQAFYEKDLIEIDFEQFKKFVLEQMQSNGQESKV